MNKKQCLILLIVFTSVCLFTYNYELLPDLDFKNFPSNEDIACYSIESDSLPNIDAVYPKEKSIYFHETSCKGGLTSKQACSIESAARTHKDYDINVIFSGPVNKIALKDINFELLSVYSNVKFFRVYLEDFCKNTPVEDLVKNILNRTRWPERHARDILKFVTLFKYGGVYLDLETVVVKPLDGLPRNWAVRQEKQVSASAVGFGRDYVIGGKMSHAVMKEMTSSFRGDIMTENGPLLLTKVLEDICSKNCIHLINSDICQGFAVLNEKVVKTVFSEPPADFDKDPYIYNFPLHYKDNTKVSDPFYAKLAEINCPVVYKNYRQYFGM